MNNSKKSPTSELISETKKLTRAIKESHVAFKKKLWQNVLLGAMTALGGVIALAILIPLIIFVLSQLDWVPMFGDIAAQMNGQMEVSR
jgi:Domain of unknown function (DUF5665)